MLAITLLVFTLFLSSSSASTGEEIGQFFNNLGKGIEQFASNVADDVRGWTMDFVDLDMKLRKENEMAIESYKRGEINDEQLRTRLYINRYEYQQAVDDRIRQKMGNRL